MAEHEQHVWPATGAAVFMRNRDDWGRLSNMHGAFPPTVSGTRFRTSEALYQACRFPYNPEIQQAILAERSPMEAKRRARERVEASRPDWMEARVDIMRWVLQVKLACNPGFATLLRSTEPGPIVERSFRDSFWGAKPTGDGATLSGENRLGRLLMEIRESVKDGAPARDVPPPALPDFLLFTRPVETVRARTET